MFSHRSAVATVKERHFPELAPHDSSIIPSQAQEPSREFSWLSQWRPASSFRHQPHLPACFPVERPPSPQDQWTSQEFTPTILFSRFRTRPRFGPSEKHQCPKTSLNYWTGFQALDGHDPGEEPTFVASDDASLENPKGWRPQANFLR